MANEPTTAVEAKPELTIAQLQAAFEKNRADRSYDVKQLLADADVLSKRVAQLARDEAAKVKAAATAKFEAAMAAIKGPVDACKGGIGTAVKGAESAFVAAGVDTLTIVVSKLGTEERTISIKPSGPGVPTSAPRAASTGSGTGSGAKGRVTYSSPDGSQTLSRAEFVTAITGDANPNPNGLSVKADRLAAQHGWTRHQGEAS